MKNYSRLLKLVAVALLAGSLAMVKDWPGASAQHEGHKKGHAPAKARKARNPVERNTANIENGKALQKAGFTPAPNPAKAGSISPNLTITHDQRLLLSWVEPVKGNRLALKYAVAEQSQWAAPRTVVINPSLDTRGKQPSVIRLADRRLIAFWNQRKNSRGEDVWSHLYFSTSGDDGSSWSLPRVVHRDLSVSLHGKISAVPIGANELAIIWLDERKEEKTEQYSHLLVTTTIRSDGTLGQEQIIDGNACPCCPTALVKTSDGLLAAYRDHEAGDLRDISLLRFTNGQWGAPQNLHRDGWKINGCPGNAAALVADGERVVAAWFTAANDKPAVKAAFSSDGGRTFGQPLILSPDGAIGRPAVTMLSDGTGVVAWVKNVGGSSRLVINRIKPDGSISAPTMLGKTGKSFPRIARAGQQVMVAWTDPAGAVKTVIVNGQIENQPVGSFLQ